MKLLMDTSAYVAFKLGVGNVVDMATSSEQILFSAVVLGELIIAAGEKIPGFGR
jgi:hypothetical protein